MIQKLVDRYMANKHELEKQFSAKHVDDYKEIVKAVVTILHDDQENDSPDPERIHEIDDGDYEGTLLYIIGASGYQPSKYWAVKVYYGSCSGCDTLQAIHDYSSMQPNDEQVKDYMTLALHIVQGIKEIDCDDV